MGSEQNGLHRADDVGKGILFETCSPHFIPMPEIFVLKGPIND